MYTDTNDLALLASFATILGIPIAVLALVYAALQLRKSARIAKGQFLLQIENQSTLHDEVHHKLFPDGEWGVNKGGSPHSIQDTKEVADYLGFFEQCEYLIQTRCLDFSTFKKIYGYRVKNILSNTVIVESKLQGETRKFYELFISLCTRLGHRVPVSGKVTLKPSD